MSHAEIARRRTVNAVEAFLSALDAELRKDRHPLDRWGFVTSRGVLRIQNDSAGLSDLRADVERLRDALATRRAEHVQAELRRLWEREHAVPHSTTTDFPALYNNLLSRARDHIEISSFDIPEAPKSIPNRPSNNAFIAWRLRDLEGLKGPTAIAEEMTKQLGRKVRQGTVSRWLQWVDAYRKASGIFPELPGITERPYAIDPTGHRHGQTTRPPHPTPTTAARSRRRLID